MIGTIKTLVGDKGYGFIKDADGKEYFFHASALKNVEFKALEVGREVTFEDSEGTKGPRAEDIYV
jgi:CspA family cold shock protein